MVQIVLTVLLGIVILGIFGTVGVTALADQGVANAWMYMMFFMGIIAVLLIGVGIALPWIVLTALKKRNEKWATAAMVSLIVQVVLGGGALSLFPLISVILLLDKEASAYIGMK